MHTCVCVNTQPYKSLAGIFQRMPNSAVLLTLLCFYQGKVTAVADPGLR